MTIKSCVSDMTRILAQSGIQTPRLDTLVLLEDITGKDRSWLLAHDDETLPPSQAVALRKSTLQRSRHQPLAYIRRTTEFYGRTFTVSPDVLVPRPESEDMIGMLKSLVVTHSHDSLRVIDVGTGSGALAITAKCEIPDATVIAIDIDEACLKIARKNAQHHGVVIDFLHGNLLDPLSETPSDSQTIILANLPYVPDDYPINEAAKHEPKHALFGGIDGLDFYHQLFQQASLLRPSPSSIICESLPFQHQPLADLAVKYSYRVIQECNFVQLFVPKNLTVISPKPSLP